MNTSVASTAPLLVDHDRSVDTRHRRDLDGLRAVAALSVIACHTFDSLPGGGTGVDMFFVLSGYLISGILLRGLLQDRFSFSDFYARRIKRIFPALLAVLFTVWVIGSALLLPDEYRKLGKDVATSATFSLYIFSQLEQLYALDFNLGGNLLSHLWSLGVEEQFYLFWPLFLVTIWRLSKRRMQCVIGAMTVAIAVSFAFLVASERPSAISIVPWQGLWELSAGGLVASLQLSGFSVVPAVQKLPSWICALSGWVLNRHALGIAAAALLVFAIVRNPSATLFSNSWTIAPSIGVILLIAAGPRSFVNKHLLGSPPMVFIGQISYPLYLWHLPILIFVWALTWERHPSSASMFGIVTASALILAFFTYRLLEVPIRFHARRAAVPVLLGLMVVCGIVGIAAFFGGIRPLSYFRGNDLVHSTTEDWLDDSDSDSWTTDVDDIRILGRSSRHALFIGDSNMQQYYPRIEQLASGKSPLMRNAIFAAKYGCVPGLVEVHIAGRDDASCQKYFRRALSYAADPNVDVIVIAAAWYANLIQVTDLNAIGQVIEPLKPDANQAIESLRRTIGRLTRSGKRVYLVINLPVGAILDPRARWDRTRLVVRRSSAEHMDKRTLVSTLEPITSKLRDVAKETGATIIDPLESLCDTTRCPGNSASGESMYHDLWHLRPSYVRAHVNYLDFVMLEP